MMTSPHIPSAYQPPSISAMMEQLNVCQQKNEHCFHASAGTDSQNVELMTANHRVCLIDILLCCKLTFLCWQGMLILPHSLIYHAHQDQLMELLQSRWHEHLGEALLLVPRNRNEGIKLQKLLMEHRLRCAQLETALYAAALGLSSGG